MSKTIAIGQRFKGVPTGPTFEVIGTYQTPDGIEHVQLRSLQDRTVLRTLAASVMLDPKRFRLAAATD
jgi:hypothetical protein